MDIRPYIQFNRKISSRLTPLLARAGMSPNAVTALALASGIAAGWAMARGTHAGLLLGVALLHLSFILDNCDGELARMRGKATVFGRWFDMVADLGVDFALWSGLAAGAVAHHEQGHWLAVGLAACAGSLINFSFVAAERRAGLSTSVHLRPEPGPKQKHSLFHALLETLCHNGDCIALAWLAVLLGQPGLFLIFGAVYIHSIWLIRAATYFQKWRKALAKTAFLALGVYLLALSLAGVSWPSMAELFRRTGWALALSFLVFPLVSVFHALGLYYLVPPQERRRIPFRELYLLHLAGDSVNKITPFVDVAGEPLKVSLLVKRDFVPAPRAVALIWNARVAFVWSEVVHLLPALLLLVSFYPSREIFAVGAAGVAFSSIFAFILSAAKKKTLKNPAAMAWGPGARGWAASIFWNTAGWVALTLEVYVLFRLLGVPVDLLQAFLAQSLLQAVKTVSFFIPANLGAQEGGLAYLFRHFGFSSTEGIALSLFKRARQFVWALIGYAVFSAMNRPAAAPSEAASLGTERA